MTYYNYLGQPMPETAPEDNGKNNILGTPAGNETIQAPAGNSSVAGDGGGDKLIGSSGDNTFWITDPKDIVVEQPNGGIDTENGWMPLKLAPNVENLVVQGAYNYGMGNELDNLIIVQNGQNNWLYGGPGNDVLVGEAQQTTFVVRAGEGNDVIYNWNSSDQLQLLNYGFSTAAQIRGAMRQVGPDTVIQLSASETLTIRNTTPASFADGQFLLPLDRTKLGALTFDDEFNSLQLYDPSTNTGLWRTDFGGNLKGRDAYSLTENGELQVYTHAGFQGTGDQNLGLNPFSVSNGVLTIEARPLTPDQTSAAFGAGYSSGMLNTFGSFAQKYGYFEMRAETPEVAGAWPAFWMTAWPYNGQGEADIMEALGVTPNVDYRRAWGGDVNVFDNALKIDPSGYHTYGLLWTPQTITFYFDDQAVLQAPTPASWTSPMSLIVNLAVGGFGGTPDPSSFPADLHIDYVRAYGLADGSSMVTRGQFETPLGTMRADGGTTAGQANAPPVFQDTGQPVTSAEILTFAARPDASQLPAGKAFVVWQDSGALFGAVSNGQALGQATPLMAGDLSLLTGGGTFLTDEKVVIGYWGPGANGRSAWALVYDPATQSVSQNQLGAAVGDVRFVATADGDFAASWLGPGGAIRARSYDSFAYDGKGWYGQTTVLTGDLVGVTAGNELIAANGSGQQLYATTNSYMNLVGEAAFAAPNVSGPEGTGGTSYLTFTVNRTDALWQKATVAWAVTPSGANPVNAEDFPGGVLPSGVVTFDINAASETIAVPITADSLVEPNEQFTITLFNPVGTSLGAQSTATGTILNDDGGTSPPPPPPPPPAGTGVLLTATTTPATLTGGAGDDTLNASQGADLLTGGAGADTFAWAKEPWAPAHITDFVVGIDRLNLSALFQQVGYTGSDPVADHYIILQSDGAGGTEVLLDPDGPGAAWPVYIINLDHAVATTWAQLAGQAPGEGGGVLHAPPGGGLVQGSDGPDTIYGADAGNSRLLGGGGDDVIYVYGGANTVNGNMGADTIHSEAGASWLSGGKDNDLIYANGGDNTVNGNLGNDTIHGGDAGNYLRGGQGDDVIVGGAGNDNIWGDRGDNTVSGGGGADTFHIYGVPGVMVVTDFNYGEGDRVRIDDGAKYAATQQGADVVINLAGGGQMILQHTPLTSLGNDWIT